MTLNDDSHNTGVNEPQTTSSGKPARRRVTRATSSPAAQPVQFLTAETAPTAAPKTTVGGAAVVSGTNTTEATGTAPRRSRRATSSGRAAGAAVAVAGTATEIAAQATEVNERSQTAQAATEEAPKKTTTAKKSTAKSAKGGAKGSSSAAQSSDAEAAAEKDSSAAPKTTRSRSRKKPDAAVDTVAEASADTPAVEEAAPQSEKPKTTRSRTRTSAKSATAQAKDATEVAETEAPSESKAQSSQSTEKPKTGRGRSRRGAGVFSDPTAGAVSEAPAAPVRPRLATTALLFQAPDLNAVPEPVVAEVEEEETEEVVEVVEQAPRRSRNQRNRKGSQERRSNQEHTATDEDVQGAAQGASQDQAETKNAKAADEETEESAEDQTEGTDEGQDESDDSPRRRRRRGGRGRRNRNSSDNDSDSDSDDNENDSEGSEDSRSAGSSDTESESEDTDDSDDSDDEYSSSRRRRRRRRSGRTGEERGSRTASDEVTALKGSTRLEAKRQRRREGRDAGRRRTVITEAEFLARRESVERSMVVRERDGRTQIAVLEDGVLVEHYVSQQSSASMAGNVYLGRVQNVLPSMEAAFIDIGKGRNAVLYAGEVNWDAHGVDGQPRRIEQALKSGDTVLVQVTKDPIGHKGARLTSQVTLAGRYLVYVPGGGMTGISRKLPDVERSRLKRILREVVPEGAGVIVRTAAEGASEEELKADIARLQGQWEKIEKKSKTANAPALLQGEPDLAIRVVRDIFNDDFTSLKVQGHGAWEEISSYVAELAPDLADRVTKWVDNKDIFSSARVDEQLAKGMDRKVWLPSGGSLVIDRTEAMTVIDVNTGKFTGQGGTLEETVTRNNIEAAEEIVRQLRLRDIGGIIVIDFIDMVLESNRDLVLRRLVECLGRDRTKHQVAEVTSLGLVQMTRKRVGQGLVEAFSTTCEHCNGRGFIVHEEPNEKQGQHVHNNSPEVKSAGSGSGSAEGEQGGSKRSRRKRNSNKDNSGEAAATQGGSQESSDKPAEGADETRDAVKATLATIAAAAASAHEASAEVEPVAEPVVDAPAKTEAPAEVVAETAPEPVEQPEETAVEAPAETDAEPTEAAPAQD